MKHLITFILSLLLLCSCNNNDEPPTETVLPISKYYQPCTSEFNITDTEWLDKIKGWADKKFVVNDLSELPDDPLGFSEGYTSVDFKEYNFKQSTCGKGYSLLFSVLRLLFLRWRKQ